MSRVHFVFGLRAVNMLSDSSCLDFFLSHPFPFTLNSLLTCIFQCAYNGKFIVVCDCCNHLCFQLVFYSMGDQHLSPSLEKRWDRNFFSSLKNPLFFFFSFLFFPLWDDMLVGFAMWHMHILGLEQMAVAHDSDFLYLSEKRLKVIRGCFPGFFKAES